MGLEELIPLVVEGGLIKKFSDNMLGQPKQQRSRGKKKGKRTAYSPGKYKPF